MATTAAEIRFLTERLNEWEAFRAENGTSGAEGEPEPLLKRKGLPSKHWAIQKVLSENPLREWKLSELRDELVHRKWLADDEAATHALQVYIGNMAKRGEVDRPGGRKGYYRYKLPEFKPLSNEELATSA
jgi:hypothetical protein